MLPLLNLDCVGLFYVVLSLKSDVLVALHHPEAEILTPTQAGVSRSWSGSSAKVLEGTSVPLLGVGGWVAGRGQSSA